jgi:hypothetical protein
VALAAFAGCFLSGIHYRFDETLHARLSFYALPAAISVLHHGAPFDHTALAQVADLFFAAHPHVTDETIHRAIEMRDIDASRILLVPADDKGAIDLAILSLFLFGPHVASLYYGAFLLLGISAAVFAAQFRREPEALSLLALYLLALWCCVPVFALTKELYSFDNPRVFGVLAVLPTLHLARMIGRRATIGAAALCAVQILLLLECLQVRSTEIWAFLAIGSLALWTLARRRSLAVAWPGFAAGAGLLLLTLYQSATYNPAYFSTDLRGRLFWHNVGIGFALHPKLAQKYHLTLSDNFWTLVHAKAQETGGDALVQAVFGDKKQPEWTGIARDAGAYERLARSVVFDIVRANPRQTAELFLVYKPRLLVRTALWAAGLYPDDYEKLYIRDQLGSLTPPEERRRNHVYWRPFSLPALLALGLLAFAGRVIVPWSTLGVILLCSLIAPAATYPAIHTLAVPFVAATMLLQAAALVCLAALKRGIAGRIGRRRAQSRIRGG